MEMRCPPPLATTYAQIGLHGTYIEVLVFHKQEQKCPVEFALNTRIWCIFEKISYQTSKSFSIFKKEIKAKSLPMLSWVATFGQTTSLVDEEEHIFDLEYAAVCSSNFVCYLWLFN